MIRWCLPLLLLGGCATAEQPATQGQDRIVSLDYCADQMVLGLVERHRIAAVSPEVTADPLFSERLAQGIPTVHADAERILALRPTLVVRSYVGGARLEAALERAGVRVLTLPYADDLAGVRAAVVTSGRALGAETAAARRLASFDRQIAGSHVTGERALYTTPGDYTAGPSTLINDVIIHAGLRNAETRAGWHRLNSERLIADPPRVIIHAFGESVQHHTDRWSSSDHSALRRVWANGTHVALPGSFVACANWRAGEAVARLRASNRS